MAEGDDYNLDLSYMDENSAEGHQQHHQDGDYQYDDSTELYGDENYEGDHGNIDHAVNGDSNAKVDSVDTAQGEANAEQSAETDASGSRKRKERDDDDDYSQTAQNMTPRQTSSTPVPSQHSGYGPQPTHALNIQQLGHNMSEETIREWVNAVGKESEIEELKFDEFKPNGKSKGACYVRFTTPEAAQLVKDYIANTVPKPPGKPAGYVVHYANSNPYLRSSNNTSQGANRTNARGGLGGDNFRGGRGNFRGNFNRGGGFVGRGNYNNMGGVMPNMNQGGWNNQGGMAMGGGFNNMAAGGFNNRGGMNNRGRGGMGVNMGRGGGMNMGMNQGGMMGGMGRGGMPAMPTMPMMNPMMGMPSMFNMPNMMGGMQNRGGMMGGNMMGGVGRGGFPAGQQGGMNKRPRMG
ncbi:uncharacterized protein PV09_01710 [Verruconis gallopava]|uniref:RRM domain-containing protein n=1 Tax=Verruconis gallopava TaxID=253628 RepID=A0A0D2B956_9PEZI|nr:uncharacterized protein PV09_01710 [Verruconis gallopava]KIW07784.1 hypothetical protein PV09_01710 [Verruconis gallopava]